MVEKLKHREAFEAYYQMGASRSYIKLSKVLNCATTSVEKWGIAFDWQERLKQRDEENAKHLEEITNKHIIEEKIAYRAIIKSCIDLFKENLNNKQVDISSVKDLITLMNEDLMLLGEPTIRTESVQNHKDTNIKGEEVTSSILSKLTEEELHKIITNTVNSADNADSIDKVEATNAYNELLANKLKSLCENK